MTNRANVFKVSEADLKEELSKSKETVFERYYECPVCGYEPYPGVPASGKGCRVNIPFGYFCPKCYAISLAVAVRVKVECLHLLEAPINATNQGTLQNRIEALERAEAASRQKMLSVIDPYKMYQKIQNSFSARRKRNNKKGVTAC